MPAVFILNRGPHDYTDAANFGSLVFCTEGVLDKSDVLGMRRALEEHLQDSEPEDYILLGSLTSLCCVACSIMVALHGELHLLIHTGSHYIDRSLHFHNQPYTQEYLRG